MTSAGRIVGALEGALETTNGLIWDWPSWPMPLMAAALLGTGLYLTVRLRLINLRGFLHAVRVVRGVYDDPTDRGDISHFQALSTALSATVGVGNIAGVAAAIHYGGPGALLWMWITALLGMTTKFTECTLALRYRQVNADGSVSGGPMYAIEHGLGRRWKPLAALFAACAAVSAFGQGDAVQAHTMATAVHSAYGIPTWATGLVATTLLGLVIVGGIRRIGAVTARVIPLMALIYVAGAVSILLLNYRSLPQALLEIVNGAFSPTAAIGGFAGSAFSYTMVWGIKRGLFSNEAGQGSAPIAHAAARTDEPVREGSVALLEPFIDTLSICTLTGLVIIVTGVWQDQREASYPLSTQSEIRFVDASCSIERDGRLASSCVLAPGRYALRDGAIRGLRLVRFESFVGNPRVYVEDTPLERGHLSFGADLQPLLTGATGQPIADATIHGTFAENGEPLTAWAFERGLAPILPFGDHIVTLCVFLFALSTSIGWSYYGDRSIQYLRGDRAVLPYRLAFLALHLVGAISTLKGVWTFGDLALGLMALPNLLATLLLSNQVAKMSDDYYQAL